MPSFKNTMSTPEVQKLLSSYQSGVAPLEPDEVPQVGSGSSAPAITPKQLSMYQQAMRMPVQRGMAESNIDEAIDAGFGTSQYDTDFYEGMDLEHNRALEQSGFAKIGLGLVKGGITAATTAVNTTLGTVWGLGSALYELAFDTNGNGRSFMDTLDAGVNNWVSSKMVGIQNWAEEAMPNYRTQEERSEKYQKEWYKHMGTANFIGDSILKNFGFTVGAMGGGMVWTKFIGAGMSKRLANNIMKGVAAAAEGDAEASAGLQRALEAIQRGTAVGVDAEKLVANIENAAKAINRMEARLQLYGSVIGAMGEGTTEGLMAKDEFLKDFNSRMQQQYASEYAGLEDEILATNNPDWVEKRVIQNPDGTMETRKVLTEKGQRHLLNMQRQTTEKYEYLAGYAQEQGDRLASTTFLLNLPILTTSNLVQFGRMFSGGWKTNRANLSALRGGVKTTGGKAPSIEANYKPSGSRWGRTILNSLKVAGSESFEEMAQGTVSSGAKAVADARIAAFNDSGFDEDATHTVQFWFENMSQGGKDYLGDIKNWQEGALGAFTGLFGIPGKRWNGGIVEAYRDAKSKTDASAAAANQLNSLINSKDFQDRWHGYIRHLKYDNQMQAAVEADDEYAWHTADDAQLISDIITFADTGRLEDLNQIVSMYGTMSEADAASIREVTKNTEDESQDWTKNLSDKEVVDKVAKQAKKMQDTIKEYKDIYQALSSRAPIGTSPEFLKELVFTAMQIKSFDRRFLEMFGETMDAIEPLLLAMSSVREDGTVAPAEESAERYKRLRDSYERLFAGALLPVKMPKVIQDSIDNALNLLDGLTSDDDELNKKVSDMRALTEDRKEFYRKLQTLQGAEGQKKFEEAAVTTEKVEEQAEKVHAQQQTEGLNTINDVKQAYFEKDANGRAAFLELITPLEDSNTAVKEFLKLKRRFDSFQAFVEKNGVQITDPTVSPRMIQSALNDLIRRARNEDELINLPDNVFSTFDEFVRDYTGTFGAPGASTYAAVKAIVRQAMQEYMAGETSTATRHTVNPQPVAPQPQPGTVATPQGYDASQPSSQEPAPVAQPEKPKTQPQPQPELEPEPAPQAPVQEEPETVQPVSQPTQEDLQADSATAAADPMPASVEEEKIGKSGEKPKTAYYRTSVPEIETAGAKKARQAIASGDRTSLMQADLSDFIKNHPEYAEIWNALSTRGAFANVATQLEVGDEIEFVIDPTFPTYNGNPQILMTTTKNGQRLVLSILSAQTSQYFGLDELRKTILEDYRKFINAHPNDTYVFGKKSRVWAKRAGLIDYDFSGESEKGIVNIPGYDDSAPIVFINRNGDAEVINDGPKDAVRKVSLTFDDAEYNKDTGKRGNLYYLVKVDADKYVPIRLNVEHFRQENKDYNYPAFTKIREILENIAGIVKETNNTNLEEQNGKLRTQLQELGKYLDIHDMFFELGQYENVGVALRYSQANNESTLRRPDQMTGEWLIDFIAGKNRSLQLRQDSTGKIQNIRELIETGAITSNARMLRPKGTDFYINPWFADKQEFGPATQTQADVEFNRRAEVKEEIPVQKEVPVVDDLDFDFGGRDEFDAPEEVEPAQGEKTPTEREQQASQQQTSEILSNLKEALLKTKRYSVGRRGNLSVSYKDGILTVSGYDSGMDLDFGVKYRLVNGKLQASTSQGGGEYGEFNTLEELYDTTRLVLDALNKINPQMAKEAAAEQQINEAVGKEEGDPIPAMIHQKFSEYPKDVQDALLAKGYDEKLWDSITDKDLLKEQILRCLGV